MEVQVSLTQAELCRLLDALGKAQRADLERSCSRNFAEEEIDEQLQQKLLRATGADV